MKYDPEKSAGDLTATVSVEDVVQDEEEVFQRTADGTDYRDVSW